MYPINQVILGSDPMLNGLDDLDAQIQKMEVYKNRLQQLKLSQNQVNKNTIWDEIDKEISPMTEEQKIRLFNNEDYVNIYNKIQNMVQSELLSLVKSKIESSSEGKELLQAQLKMVKHLKKKIVEDTTKEMELFTKFKEFSKENPGTTYDEFIKNNM